MSATKYNTPHNILRKHSILGIIYRNLSVKSVTDKIQEEEIKVGPNTRYEQKGKGVPLIVQYKLNKQKNKQREQL